MLMYCLYFWIFVDQLRVEKGGDGGWFVRDGGAKGDVDGGGGAAAAADGGGGRRRAVVHAVAVW